MGAWKASGYLLNYGASQPKTIYNLSWLEHTSQKSELHIETLLKHELNDEARMGFLASCWQDLKSFADLVGRLWPYNEFYTAAYEDHRLDLAMVLLRSLGQGEYSPSPAVFQHLCEPPSLAETGSSTTIGVLSCITLGLGYIVWYDPDVASKWYSAIRDTALRLDKSLLMPEQHLHGRGVIHFPYYQLFPPLTPFANMFVGSTLKYPGYHSDPKCRIQHMIGYRLAKCDRALQMWLEILQECGIDLLEYGRQERQILKDREDGCEFKIYGDVLREEWCFETENDVFEIRLIGFEYGTEPGDWKLWWSEPTDGLVGDFWKEMEPEPLRIPGSWDEDF